MFKYRSYDEAYNVSINKPEEFWAQAAEAVSWIKKWDVIFTSPKPQFYKWFEGAQMNTCYNAVDRHVESGRKDQVAIIYDSPVTNTVKKITYGEVLASVSLVAGMLEKAGVKKGDRVIIYMPMIPETLFAMLACARIGAVHSVVFGGFAPNELAIRIDDAKPKVILSATCGIEPKGAIAYKPLLDKAIELSKHKPQKCFILQRPQVKAELTPGRDFDWEDALKSAKPAGMRYRAGNRSALHSLYIRNNRNSQRRGERQRRACRGAFVEHEKYLRHRTRRCLLGGIGCGLGCRPFLYRLRTAALRRHNNHV